MDEFYQIITELWPLIDVQNFLLLNTNGRILIIFCYKISSGRVCCMPAALSFKFWKTSYVADHSGLMVMV